MTEPHPLITHLDSITERVADEEIKQDLLSLREKLAQFIKSSSFPEQVKVLASNKVREIVSDVDKSIERMCENISTFFNPAL